MVVWGFTAGLSPAPRLGGWAKPWDQGRIRVAAGPRRCAGVETGRPPKTPPAGPRRARSSSPRLTRCRGSARLVLLIACAVFAPERLPAGVRGRGPVLRRGSSAAASSARCSRPGARRSAFLCTASRTRPWPSPFFAGLHRPDLATLLGNIVRKKLVWQPLRTVDSLAGASSASCRCCSSPGWSARLSPPPLHRARLAGAPVDRARRRRQGRARRGEGLLRLVPPADRRPRLPRGVRRPRPDPGAPGRAAGPDARQVRRRLDGQEPGLQDHRCGQLLLPADRGDRVPLRP